VRAPFGDLGDNATIKKKGHRQTPVGNTQSPLFPVHSVDDVVKCRKVILSFFLERVCGKHYSAGIWRNWFEGHTEES